MPRLAPVMSATLPRRGWGSRNVPMVTPRVSTGPSGRVRYLVSMKASSRQVRSGRVSAAPASSRDRLLAAAARLFEEKGYGAVTVGEIAQVAKVSRPTAYRHFADKEDMLWVLTEQAGEHVLSIIARVASSSASPSEQIRELVCNHADAF